MGSEWILLRESKKITGVPSNVIDNKNSLWTEHFKLCQGYRHPDIE